MQFNRNLTLLRKKKGLSQEELAFLVGVSRQTIYTWEAGVAYPNILILRKLADALEVSTDALLNGFEVQKLPKSFQRISLTYVGPHKGEVVYEELPNWFVRLNSECEVNWALYDWNGKAFIRDYSYHVEVHGTAVIHDLEGIEIEVKEYDPELNFTRTYNQFISVKDEGVAWIGQITYKDGKKTIKTYKDQSFLDDWGYDKKLIYQSMKYERAEDYVMEFEGNKYSVIKISYFDPDGSDDPKHAYFEVFLNQDLESLLWRRFTKKSSKQHLSGETIRVGGAVYDMDYYSLTSRI